MAPERVRDDLLEHGASPQHAYAEIKKMITAGRLKPGGGVSERELEEVLGLSRTPIRTALAILGKEGLVEQIPRFGTIVRITPPEEIKEIFALRYVIESLVASQLARQPAEDRKARIAKLRLILEDASRCKKLAESAIKKNNQEQLDEVMDQFMDKDAEFHTHRHPLDWIGHLAEAVALERRCVCPLLLGGAGTADEFPRLCFIIGHVAKRVAGVADAAEGDVNNSSSKEFGVGH